MINLKYYTIYIFHLFVIFVSTLGWSFISDKCVLIYLMTLQIYSIILFIIMGTCLIRKLEHSLNSGGKSNREILSRFLGINITKNQMKIGTLLIFIFSFCLTLWKYNKVIQV